MLGYLLVFIGGGIGAALRHGVNRVAPLVTSGVFPANTFFVNIVGCFLMGFLTGCFAYRGEQFSQKLRLFLTTGILGGFTTFSAFSLDVALLYQKGQLSMAFAYVLLSMALSLVGVFAGLAVARSVFS